MTFFRALDNSGIVKVNFISDDSIAESLNEASRGMIVNNKPIPPTTSPRYMGGYTYPILADIAQGRTIQILKADLPGDSIQAQIAIRETAIEPETVYGIVDGGDVTIVQIEGFDRSTEGLSHRGWNIQAKPKTFKRLKTLHRPFRLYDFLDRPLKVLVVDDDAYTNLTLPELKTYNSSQIEMLLDGAFVISRELFDNCLTNVKFPEKDPHEMRPELMVNHYRNQEYLRQAQRFHAFNARIFGPMDFGRLDPNDSLWSTPGMLKGEAFIDVADHCENLGVDVICTRSALKFEVSNSSQVIVEMEPQKAKRSEIRSDLQTMVTLPAIYEFDGVKTWTREYLLGQFQRLCNDEIMESWFDMSAPMFNSSRFFDQNDVTSLTKWNARAWLLSGMKITQSPWLFEQLGAAMAKSLNPQGRQESKLKFPVPCAVRAQVISQSFASMCGYEQPVVIGSIHWAEPLEALVVNDADWMEMYHSHGGMDLDDFFVGYWRTVGNLRKIIIVRSPNDWGEYSSFDYVEGDWYPEFVGHLGNITIFPEVSTDPTLWAPRLSEMVRSGEIIYTGLPSENAETVKVEPHAYSHSDMFELLTNNKSSGSCVGASVNSRMLNSMSTKTHRPVQLASMEKCIDTGTQGGSLEDAEAVMAEAKEIVQQLIADPAVKIDEYLWRTRFQQIFKDVSFDRSRLDSTSHIAQADKFRFDVAGSFMNKVRDYAQSKLTANVDVNVHRLGMKYINQAYRLLMDTRMQMVLANNPGQQNMQVHQWESVHSGILDKLLSFTEEQIVDRHDFVLAFYSANMKSPTSKSKKITDQLVMNPHVFPYLLEALRFYGIAYHINVNDKGELIRHKHTEWNVSCAQCGTEFTLVDPKVLQRYYHFDQACVTCRTKETTDAKE